MLMIRSRKKKMLKKMRAKKEKYAKDHQKEKYILKNHPIFAA